MGGGGGGGSSANKSVTIRYAPYIESRHDDFLQTTMSHTKAVLWDSPYSDRVISNDMSTAFLGAGNTIAMFPALYDMFGKHLAGFDIEVVWQGITDKLLNKDERSSLSENRALVDRDLQFATTMRDINAVNSSSFVLGKSRVEDIIIKHVFGIHWDELYGVLHLTYNKFIQHLQWQKEMVVDYAMYMKLYFQTMIEGIEHDYGSGQSDNEETNDYGGTLGTVVANKLWPFLVLDFEQKALGALQVKDLYLRGPGKRGRSALSKALLVASYTVQGAVIGSYFGPGWGTVIGAVVGFCIGVAVIMSE